MSTPTPTNRRAIDPSSSFLIKVNLAILIGVFGAAASIFLQVRDLSYKWGELNTKIEILWVDYTLSTNNAKYKDK